MERAFDLIVVGAGLAGLTATNRALDLGQRVVLLERSTEPRHVCASRTNGGVFHVGFRSVKADPEELVRTILAATSGFTEVPVATALARNAARGVEWLEELGTPFTAMTPDDGWKDYVLAPLGFHDKTTLTWEDLGADRLITRLETRARGLGAVVRRGCRAAALLVESGVVVGVEAEGPGGHEVLRASAVLLADGGFEADQTMIRRYLAPEPKHLKLRGSESGHGDGIRMAAAAGAKLLGMEAFYGHILSADSLTRDSLSPFPFLEFLASVGMMVDRKGDRFVEETLGGHFPSNALARHGDGLAFVIFDDAMWNGIGRHFFAPPNPNLVKGGGTLHRADSIEALADLAGLPKDKLRAHFDEREAEIAARRRTESAAGDRAAMTVFAKGKYPHEPFTSPPFYAAPACAALTSTLGGIAIDANGRAVREDGSPIPGLYAAGSATGGIEGGPSVGYLGGLAKALVFGLLAAEHAAAVARRPDGTSTTSQG
jgi:fumarate reductase flavoprotein subunit